MVRKPVVVDLFNGAGGMSTGFEMAGFEVALGVEYIPRFAETFALNHPKSKSLCIDIRELSNEHLLEHLDGKQIDVVTGGPPCQGFSGAGRRDPKDPRNSLFMDFVRVVKTIQPRYFVMENVPGILTMKNGNGDLVIEIIKQEFNKIGYYVEWKKLLAADYGVPQKRRRVIFIGCPFDENKEPLFPVIYPKQTHSEDGGSQMTLSSDVSPMERWVGAGTVLLSKEDAPEKSFHSQRMIDGFRRRKEKNKAKGKGFGWQIIDPDKPCYTISARYWKDGSDALIQYSENEVRMLTQGEAAAIQTFPENYQFCGSKKDVYMQIGNAVPCLLAKAIAESILPYVTPPEPPVSPFELAHVHKIIFEDIPLAWTTRFEFFTPDLEQFPLMYVHREITSSTNKTERVYGFPIHASVKHRKEKGQCDIEVAFLCNLPQGQTISDKIIFEELGHRLGITNKVSYSDLEEICQQSPGNLPLLQAIWNDKISKVYGNFIPHGKIYDEVYGIVRFSASGNAPRLGKTSELRMLYWYMKEIGQKVKFSDNLKEYDFCEFYLIPTMDEIRNLNFKMFPNFKNHYNTIKAFWDLEYTEEFRLGDPTEGTVKELELELKNRSLPTKGRKAELVERLRTALESEPQWTNMTLYRCAPAATEALPNKAEDFDSRYRELLPEFYDRISDLRQIFNRMPGRMYGYIWNMMTFIETGYEDFTKRDAFSEFLQNHHSKKGSSSKVLACILQQCFGLEALQ